MVYIIGDKISVFPITFYIYIFFNVGLLCDKLKVIWY